jgi:Putative transposase
MARFLQHVLPPRYVKIRHYGLHSASHATTRLFRGEAAHGRGAFRRPDTSKRHACAHRAPDRRRRAHVSLVPPTHAHPKATARAESSATDDSRMTPRPAHSIPRRARHDASMHTSEPATPIGPTGPSNDGLGNVRRRPRAAPASRHPGRLPPSPGRQRPTSP